MRGLSANEQFVYFAVPSEREIRSVAAVSGEEVASIVSEDIPWTSLWSDSGLLVAHHDTGRLVRLDRETLEPRAEDWVTPGTVQLLEAGSLTLAHSVLQRALVGPNEGGPVIHLQNQIPAVASNGEIVAIEGLGRMTTLHPEGTLRRLAPTQTVNSLAVTSTGAVVVAAPDRLLLYPPVPLS